MTDDLNFTRRIGMAGLGAVGVAALLTRSAAAQGTGGAMDRIISEKKFKIGYIPSPPSTIKDPASGELKGFGVDAMRFICKTLSVEPVFVETTWANFVSGLNSSQFDLSIAGTFATILRAGAVQFTKPIWYLGYSAVAKKGDTRFTKPSDLNKEGIRIALIQGGASVEYAKENWPKAEQVLLSTGNLTAPFVEVAAGRVDVGVEDAWQARRFAAAQPGVTDLFGNEPYNVPAHQLGDQARQPGRGGIHERRHRLPDDHRPLGQDGGGLRPVGPLLREAPAVGLWPARLTDGRVLAYLVGDDDVDVELDEHVRHRQAGDDEAGAARGDAAQVAGDGVVDRLAVRSVEQIGRHLADVLERPARLLDQDLQVLHRLVGLRGRVALAVELAVEVDAGEAGDEDAASGCSDHQRDVVVDLLVGPAPHRVEAANAFVGHARPPVWSGIARRPQPAKG